MWFKSIIVSILLASNSFAFVVWGEKVNVGKGYARTYFELNESHEPLQLGVALSREAIYGLDQKSEHEYLLPMPKEHSVAPYEYVSLFWEPGIYPQEVIYDTPHFEFNYFLIPSDLKNTITCSDTDEKCLKPIPEMFTVDGYFADTIGFPKYGWYWYDGRSPENNGGIYTHTFLYGYYDAKVSFIGPSVSLLDLLSLDNTTETIRMPTSFADPGHYPSAYEIGFDSDKSVHFVVLKEFKKFQ